jgi:hypothetical protein
LPRNSADFAISAAHLGRVEVDGWAIIGEISPLISQFEVAPSGSFQFHAIRRRAADSEFRELKQFQAHHTIVNPVPAKQVTT